jgi:hypothetical protein
MRATATASFIIWFTSKIIAQFSGFTAEALRTQRLRKSEFYGTNLKLSLEISEASQEWQISFPEVSENGTRFLWYSVVFRQPVVKEFTARERQAIETGRY